MNIKFIALFLILTMGIFGNTNASSLKEGMPAPNFDLLDQNETSHQLKNYQGKWIVLYFYPKDDTPGCTKEACEFRDDIAILQNLNVVVLGVSVDSIESHAKFAEKYSLQFPLLSDTEGKLAKQYGSLTSLGPVKLAKRHTFIIDPNGDLAKIYRKVKPDVHSDEVISDIILLQQKQ